MRVKERVGESERAEKAAVDRDFQRLGCFCCSQLTDRFDGTGSKYFFSGKNRFLTVFVDFSIWMVIVISLAAEKKKYSCFF